MKKLSSNSSAQAYINAIHMGCRCVELDCWDGKMDGEDMPIIYHGYTKTTKMKFEDAIKAIAQHSFESTESMNCDYPMILSIENHCNIQ